MPAWFIRSTSLVLSLLMFVGDPSWAGGVSDFLHLNFSSDLHYLTIPAQLGTITDQWTAPEARRAGVEKHNFDVFPAPRLPGSPAPFVVLIQDLHANVGVQKNIAAIIEHVYNRFGLSGIYSEAAFGVCDPSVLRTFPSRRAQSRLIDKLLANALVSGDDIAAARIGRGPLSPVRLVGVDDPLLYLANVQAFRDLAKVGPQAAQEWKGLRDFLLPGAEPRLRRHLELTEALLELKLLDSDWLEYKEHRELTPRGGTALTAAITAGERFYTAAEARNGAFTQNLLEHLHDGTQLPAALVTGGFHTASIAHSLKMHGVSFVVVTPLVERLDQEALYQRSMSEPPHETVRALGGLMFGRNFPLQKLAGAIGPRLSPWLRQRAVAVPETAKAALPNGRPASRRSLLLAIASGVALVLSSIVPSGHGWESSRLVLITAATAAASLLGAASIARLRGYHFSLWKTDVTLKWQPVLSRWATKGQAKADQFLNRRYLGRVTQKALLSVILLLQLGNPFPAFETSNGPSPIRTVLAPPARPPVPHTPVEIQSGIAKKNSQDDPIKSLNAARRALADLQRRVKEAPALHQKALDAMSGLKKQIADLESPTRSAIPLTALDKAVRDLEAADVSELVKASDRAIAVLSPKLDSNGDILKSLVELRNSAQQMQQTLALLKALQAKAHSVQTEFAPQEAASLVTQLNDLEDIDANQILKGVATASEALALFNVNAGNTNGHGLAAVHRALSEHLVPSLQAAADLNAAIKSPNPLNQAEDAERAATRSEHFADLAQKNLDHAERTLSLQDRQAMAARLGGALYDKPLATIKTELAALQSTVDPTTSWGKALTEAQLSVNAWSEALDQFTAPAGKPSERIAALRRAALALNQLQNASAAFHQNNPRYDPSGLPRSVSEMPAEGQEKFQTYKVALLQAHPELNYLPGQADLAKTDPAAYEAELETRLLAQFYGDFIDDTLGRSTVLTAAAALQNVIDLSVNSANPEAQADQTAANVQRLLAEQAARAEEAVGAQQAIDSLIAAQGVLEQQIALAEKNSAGLDLRKTVNLSVVEMKKYRESINKVKQLIAGQDAASQSLRESLDALSAAVAPQANGEASPIAPGGRQLTEGETALLFRALYNVLNSLPDILDRTLGAQTKPRLLNKVFGTEHHPDEKVLLFMHDFFYETALIAARDLAGVPQAVIDQPISADDTLVSKVVESLPIMAGAPQHMVNTRLYAQHLDTTSHPPITINGSGSRVHVSWFPIVKMAEVGLGILNFGTYVNTLQNNGSQYAYNVVDSRRLKVPSTVSSKLMGIPEAYLSTRGAIDTTRGVLFGARTAYAIQLAPKVFKGLTWTAADTADIDAAKTSNSVRLFHQLQSKAPVNAGASQTVLWTANNPKLRAEDITASKDWKLEVAGANDLTDQFFAIVNGQKYLWQRDTELLSTRLAKIPGGIEGAVRAIQIDPTLFRQIIVDGSHTAWLARFAAGMNIAGILPGISDLIDMGHYDYTVRTKGGPVSTPGAPAVYAYIETKNSKNETVKMVWTENAETFYVRSENGFEYWDDADGTVIWKLKGGQASWLNTDLFYTGKWGHHRDMHYESSLKDAKLAVAALTSEDGVALPRRSESARVTFVPGANGKLATLQTRIQNEDVTFVLGDSVNPTVLNGKPAFIRGFYRVSGDAKDNRSAFKNRAKDFLGFIRVNEAGQPELASDGKTVSYTTAYTFLYSQPQNLAAFRALTTEGQWQVMAALDPESDANKVREKLREKGWRAGADGRTHLIENGKETWARWSDDSQQSVYIVDLQDPVREKVYRVRNNGEISIATNGLRSLEKVTSLKRADGAWFLEPAQPVAAPWDLPGALLIKGGTPAAVSLWIDANGVPHTRVPAKGDEVADMAFPLPGDWRFQPGVRTLEETRSQQADSPFMSRVPTQIGVDLEKLYDPAVDRKSVKTLPDGTVETSYYFSHVAHPGKTREWTGVFSQRRNVAGKIQAYRLQRSVRGLGYVQEILRSGAPTLWAPIAMLPSTIPDGAANWDSGVVPSEILARLPATQAGAEARYAFEPETGEFYLKVVAGENVYLFRNEATAAGQELIQQLQKSPSSSMPLVPLATYLPDALVARYGARTAQTFAKKGDLWLRVVPTRASTEAYVKSLLYGGRYATVLAPEFTPADFARSSKSGVKDAWGRDISVAGWTRPTGPDSTILYGGVEFQLYTNPGDDQSDSYDILEAVSGGTFTDPSAVPGSSSVTLKAGQLVFISIGGLPHLKDRAALIRGKNNVAAAYPYLVPSLRTPQMMAHDRTLAMVSSGPGSLSAYLGAGAQKIKGNWFALEQTVNGVPVVTWIFQATSAGSYRDAITEKDVKVEKGSRFVLQNSVKMAAEFLRANKGQQPAWTRNVVSASVARAHYENSAAHRGFSNATLVKGPNFTLPGTSIKGHLLMSNVDDPEAPTYFVADVSGESSEFGSVAAGDDFVLQLPPAYLQKVLDAEKDAQAVLFHPDGSVEGIKADSFNNRAFSGLKMVRDVRPEDLRSFTMPLGPKAIVQVGAKGELKGQFIALPSMNEFLARYAAGWGTLRVREGTARASIKGKRVSLAGVIGVAEHPQTGADALHPLEVDKDWVLKRMVRDVDAKGVPKSGWVIHVDGHIVDVVFGVKAAEYSLLHHGDPRLNDPKHGIVAAIYPFDPASSNQYLTGSELAAYGSLIMPIIETSPNHWEPAFWNNEKHQWHLFERSAQDSSILQPQKAPTPVQPRDSHGAIATPESIAHGVLTTTHQAGGSSIAHIAAFVDYSQQERAKKPTPTTYATEAERANAPFVDQLKKVKTDAAGHPMMTIDPFTGIAQVTFENEVNHQLTVETMKGSRLISISYFFDNKGKTPSGTVYFGPGGLEEPLFRVAPYTGKGYRVINEVYRIDPQLDAFGRRHVEKIQISGNSTILYDPAKLPEEQHPALWKVADRLTDATQPGVRSYDIYRRIHLGGADTWQLQFRTYQGITRRALWQIQYLYDAEGRETGEFTRIGVTSKEIQDLRHYADDNGRPPAPVTAAWMRSRVETPVPLRSVEGDPGHPLFPKDTLEHLGILTDAWVVRSVIDTSWGATNSEIRQVGDARHILFQQGNERRLNVAFDGDNPTLSYVLDPTNRITDEASFAGYRPYGEIYSTKILTQMADRVHIPLSDLKRFLSDVGIAEGTQIPVVELRHRLMRGNANGPMSFEPAALATEVYLFPKDPPRGRELGRFIPRPPITASDRVQGWLNARLPGDYVLNHWWLESGTNSTQQQIPFGILPESIQLRYDRSFQRRHYSGVQRLNFKTHDGQWLKDLDGKEVPDFLKALQGEEANAYEVESTDFSEQQLAILFTKGGVQIAEDYKHQVVSPANGVGGISLATSTDGIERLYYNPTKNFRVPVLSVLTTDPLRFYLQPNQFAFDSSDHEQQLKDEKAHKEHLKEFDPLLNKPAADDVVVKQFDDDQFSPYRGFQMSDVRSREREGMDRSKIFPQFTRFVGDVMQYKTRPELLKSWFIKGWRTEVGFAAFIALVAVLFALVGAAASKMASLRRAIDKGLTTSDELSKASPPLSDKELDSVVDAIGKLGSRYDFAEEDLSTARDKLVKPLRQFLLQGGTLEAFFKDQFDYYQNDWLNQVVKPRAFSYVKFDPPGRSPMTEVTEGDVVADTDAMLENLLLWKLVDTRLSNFRNGLPAFRSFIFQGVVERAMQTPRSTSDRATMGPMTVAQWMDDQVQFWHNIIETNMQGRGNRSQGEYLLYEDVQGLFRSAPFVDAYRVNKNIVPSSGSAAEWKTFTERTRPTPFSLEGHQGHIYATQWIYFTLLLGFSSLAIYFTLGLSFLSLPAAGAMLAISGLLIAYHRRLESHQKIRNIAAAASVLPQPSSRLQKMRGSVQAAWSELAAGSVFWTLTLATKAVWDIHVFSWIHAATSGLLQSYFWFPHGNLILVGLIWSLFGLIFYLETFAFFYLYQALFVFGFGRFLGVGKVKSWKGLNTEFQNAQKQFYRKGLPSGYPEERRFWAWAITWNQIIDKMREDDLLNDAETKNYKYVLPSEEQMQKAAYVLENIETPTLNAEPENKLAAERLEFYVNSLFMKMPQMPDWRSMYSRTVITPVFNEEVLYGMDYLNKLEETGKTNLTYLIEIHGGEWKNFVERLRRDGDKAGGKNFSISDLDTLAQLKPGEALENLSSDELVMEVRFWASNRFQALSRTVRGIMNQRDALLLQAKIQFPTRTGSEISQMIDEKFQYIASYQTYMELDPAVPDQKAKWDDIFWLRERFPSLEMAYVKKEGDTWYSELIRGASEKPVHRTRLAGTPATDGKKKMGEGKPENQTVMMNYVTGQKIETIDVNQDFDFEEALKMPNLQEEMRVDPTIKLMGFPERISTRDFSLEGKFSGFADATFVTGIQSFLHLMGVRWHYGHPDVWDASWAQNRTGVSGKSYVNEDIIAGYDTYLQGGRIGQARYIRAVKAREVSMTNTASLDEKFAAGAAQYSGSRYLKWINNFKMAMNRNPELPWFARAGLFFVHMLTHYFGATGYFIRKPFVKMLNAVYIINVLLLGVSAFVSFPGELKFGLLGLFLSQAISLAGLVELWLEKGFWSGNKEYGSMLVSGQIPFFQFHTLTFAKGVQKGLSSNAKYIATGRGFALRHVPVLELYQNFASTHLNWSFGLLIMSGVAMKLWENGAIIFSAIVILQMASGFFAPFLFNRGATPRDVGLAKWWQLTHADWKSYRAVLSDLVHRRWASADAKLGTQDSGNLLTRIVFVVEGFFIMSVITLFGVMLAPFSIRPSGARWEKAEQFQKAGALGFAGALTLFAPFAFLPWVTLPFIAVVVAGAILLQFVLRLFFPPSVLPSNEIIEAHRLVDHVLKARAVKWLQNDDFLKGFRASQSVYRNDPDAVNEWLDQRWDDPTYLDEPLRRAIRLVAGQGAWGDKKAKKLLMGSINGVLAEKASLLVRNALPGQVEELSKTPRFAVILNETRRALLEITGSEEAREKRNKKTREEKFYTPLKAEFLETRFQTLMQELSDMHNQDSDAAVQAIFDEAVKQTRKAAKAKLKDQLPVEENEALTPLLKPWFADPAFIAELRERKSSFELGGQGLLGHLPPPVRDAWVDYNDASPVLAEGRLFQMLWSRYQAEILKKARVVAAQVAEDHPGAVELLAEDESLHQRPDEEALLMLLLWKEGLSAVQRQWFLDLGNRQFEAADQEWRRELVRAWLRQGVFKRKKQYPPDPIVMKMRQRLERGLPVEAYRQEVEKILHTQSNTVDVPEHKKLTYSSQQILKHRVAVAAVGLLAVVGAGSALSLGINPHIQTAAWQVVADMVRPFTGLIPWDVFLTILFDLFVLTLGFFVYRQDFQNHKKGGAETDTDILRAPQLWGLSTGAIFGLLRAFSESRNHGSFFFMVGGHMLVDSVQFFLFGLLFAGFFAPINRWMFKKFPNYPAEVGGLLLVFTSTRTLERRIAEYEKQWDQLREQKADLISTDYDQLIPSPQAEAIQKKIDAAWADWVARKHYEKLWADRWAGLRVRLGMQPKAPNTVDGNGNGRGSSGSGTRLALGGWAFSLLPAALGVAPWIALAGSVGALVSLIVIGHQRWASKRADESSQPFARAA